MFQREWSRRNVILSLLLLVVLQHSMNSLSFNYVPFVSPPSVTLVIRLSIIEGIFVLCLLKDPLVTLYIQLFCNHILFGCYLLLVYIRREQTQLEQDQWQQPTFNRTAINSSHLAITTLHVLHSKWASWTQTMNSQNDCSQIPHRIIIGPVVFNAVMSLQGMG